MSSQMDHFSELRPNSQLHLILARLKQVERSLRSYQLSASSSLPGLQQSLTILQLHLDHTLPDFAPWMAVLDLLNTHTVRSPALRIGRVQFGESRSEEVLTVCSLHLDDLRRHKSVDHDHVADLDVLGSRVGLELLADWGIRVRVVLPLLLGDLERTVPLAPVRICQLYSKNT